MKIKFCGFQTYKETAQAVELGVDYIGFIIDIESSSRSLTLEQAQKIINELKSSFDSLPQLVAVVQDPAKALLNKLAFDKNIDIIQFHGHEDIDEVKKYKPKKKVWKVFQMSEKNSQDNWYGKIRPWRAFIDAALIDIKKDSSLVELPSSLYPHISNLQDKGLMVGIGGKLTPENIHQNAEIFKPDLVDVASGIEEGGEKSFAKMTKFIESINS